jgi:YNFM family putative membrane transporter
MAGLFVAGYAIFSLVFCIQPLLPDLVHAYRVPAAESALALSLSTGGLALAILLSAVIGDVVDRRRLMLASMVGAGLVTVGGSLITDWHLFLASRFLGGLLLGGMPAVAMAYIADEVTPADVGRATAIYIAGTGLGSMMGRVAAGIIADHVSWRAALAVLGLVTLAGAILFARLLPHTRHVRVDPPLHIKEHVAAWLGHSANARLRVLLALGFILGGVFVSFFNFIGFVLMAPPFRLSQTAVSLILFVYAFGIVASVVAGELAARFGEAKPLAIGLVVMAIGIACTTASQLDLVIVGIIILTIGFFVGQAIATGWVGQVTTEQRGHAAALYLLSYYLGASLIGWAGGKVWDAVGWLPVAGLSAALVLLGALLALGATCWGVTRPERARA